ncbi:hypothetical protein NC653_015246 [Populus alba x Populus x berolinensis]|uniref:Uncharacterized protein n=1 Tax=Populus alba x Populus x berolinensis TaxID=444605 RepID=A0AAD6QK73_9ROSI|nr:hypothetical protein NC653_015246 [Populus alba x Populus x berolinensis]
MLTTTPKSLHPQRLKSKVYSLLIQIHVDILKAIQKGWGLIYYGLC